MSRLNYLNPYTFHINLYDLVFLGTIFIGLTLALLLWFSKKINQGANRFLALTLAVIVLWTTRLLGIDIRLETYLPHWDRFPLQFSLAFGPLIFFYVLKLTRPEYKFKWKDMLHFSPLLLELGVQVLEVKQSISTVAVTYHTQIFLQLNPVLQLLAFISVITYLYISHRLIERFYRRMKFNNVSDRYRYELRWLHRLLAGFSLLWLLWIPFIVADFYYQSGIHTYYPLYLLLTIMFIWVAAAAHLKAETGVPADTVPIFKPLLPAELKQKGIWLKKVVKEKRYYEDPDLSLNSLAEKLELTTHGLSRIINTVIKKNFHDFISEYRVADVVEKMQDPGYDHITLLGIAYDSGFNSKSTFNRIFKEMTGKSPAEYKTDQKKEFPVYKLGRRVRFAAVISNHQATLKWAEEKTNRNHMFKSYLKTAIRSLWKDKAFSVINIMGLAMGLACSLLIILWVYDEYNVDAFHKNGSQLYGVFESSYDQGAITAGFATQGLMADEMKSNFPEIQYASGYAWNELSTFEANNKILKVNGNHAGADFFKMFSYPFLLGNAATALRSPLDIAVSKKMAEEFFGSPENALGKTIRYQNQKDLKITGVFDNVPENSSAQFDYIINWQSFLQNNEWSKDWTNHGPLTYIMLHKGTDAKAFESKISRFLDNYDKTQTAINYRRLSIQPYSDGYLHSSFEGGKLSGGRIQYVKIFSIVAAFILLIACINFMNLTTARSVKRAKEIGVRKVAGALRSSLIKQFIGEALLVVSIAVVFAILIVMLLLPQFNQLTQKQISIPFSLSYFWLSIAVLILITGFVSGSYPALYLSALNPLSIVKGSLKFTSGALWFRKGLVVFQFVLSIILIVGTIVISKQVGYMQSVNLGYDRKNLIYVPFEGDLAAKYALFKNQALNMPGIRGITRMSQSPTLLVNGTTGLVWEGKSPESEIDFANAAIGYDFIRTTHAQITDGRDFSKEFATDSAGYIINETALKIIGYKNPLGKPLILWKKRGLIIGIVKDFHFNSLHTAIKPLIFYLGEKDDYGTALVRTKPGKTKEALASLEKICKELNPKFPFTYKFSDEEYAKLYQGEQIVEKLANYFAFLAIFISCLGLLGLVMFTAEQRTKEFGIRKVLGASPVILFNLLSKELLSLVLIALLIASPLAWLIMINWLQNYAYKINISWWMFLTAGVAAIAIALITVSFQAIKTAVANPVKSLRSE